MPSNWGAASWTLHTPGGLSPPREVLLPLSWDRRAMEMEATRHWDSRQGLGRGIQGVTRDLSSLPQSTPAPEVLAGEENAPNQTLRQLHPQD